MLVEVSTSIVLLIEEISMKQKLLSALVVAAVAGMAVNANAGVIQASYKNYAAEVFGTDTVVLNAPTIGYALALPLTGTAQNPNNFTVTWTLTDGEWSDTGTIGAVLVSPDNSSAQNAATVAVDPTNKKVLKATFTVVSNFTVASQIVLGIRNTGALNAPTLASATFEAPVTKIGTKLGAPAVNADGCSDGTAAVNVTIKLTNAANVEFDSSFPGNSNSTPIVQSAVALSLTTAASDNGNLFDNDSDNTTDAVLEQSLVNVLTPALGRVFTDGLADVSTSAAAVSNPGRINLGQVLIKDRNTLFDLNGTNAYTSQNITTAGGPVITGAVESNVLSVKAGGLFQAGGKVYLSNNASCPAPGAANEYTVTIAAGGASTVDLKATAANITAVLTAAGSQDLSRRTNICYEAPGTAVIPTAQFSLVSGSLSKITGSNEATNKICPGKLYNLKANGVQVDVRNYVPAIVGPISGGWKSVVRIINTDESQTADVTGTVLHRNGDLGASALLATLKPREVVYMLSADIDAKLNAAATGVLTSFGADDTGANARLRLTAPSSSIRVQNYVFNPSNGNFFEASAAQGDEGPALTVRDYVNK